jgi:hypothetical protein
MGRTKQSKIAVCALLDHVTLRRLHQAKNYATIELGNNS